MFKSIINQIKNYRNGKKFNAENCLKKQINIERLSFEHKIDEIVGRINYVVNTTTEEHAVIYQIHDYEIKMWNKISEYFEGLGFQVIIMDIPELNNDRYIIISWKRCETNN